MKVRSVQPSPGSSRSKVFTKTKCKNTTQIFSKHVGSFSECLLLHAWRPATVTCPLTSSGFFFFNIKLLASFSIILRVLCFCNLILTMLILQELTKLSKHPPLPHIHPKKAYSQTKDSSEETQSLCGKYNLATKCPNYYLLQNHCGEVMHCWSGDRIFRSQDHAIVTQLSSVLAE